MRNKLLVTIAAASALSWFGAAGAQPSPAQMKKDGEIKDPVAADAAIAKDEAKDAKKQAHEAHRKAQVASHKAKVSAKKADEADGVTSPSQ